MARAETGGMVDSEHARWNEDDVMLFFMEELDDCNRTPSQETGGKYPAYGKVEGRCVPGFSLTMYRRWTPNGLLIRTIQFFEKYILK